MKMCSNIPDHAACLEAALTGFVAVARIMIASGLVPPFPHEANVRYQNEPVGEEDWKLPNNVIRDGWGDCEDLALWVAAGLQETGEDPGARVIIVRTGTNKLHAVVERSDGSIEDPSYDLYQGKRGADGNVRPFSP